MNALRAGAIAAVSTVVLCAGPARGQSLELDGLRVRSGFDGAEVLGEQRVETGGWGKATMRSWSVKRPSGAWWRVVEVIPGKPPAKFTGFLERWRAGHGCTASELDSLPLSSSRGAVPPQLTFRGSCKGGDSYVARMIIVGRRGYELHVDRTIGPGPADLLPEMRLLLEQVDVLDGS